MSVNKIFTRMPKALAAKRETKIRRCFEHWAESQFRAHTGKRVCLYGMRDKWENCEKFKRKLGKLLWNEYHTKFNGAQILIVLLWEWNGMEVSLPSFCFHHFFFFYFPLCLHSLFIYFAKLWIRFSTFFMHISDSNIFPALFALTGRRAYLFSCGLSSIYIHNPHSHLTQKIMSKLGDVFTLAFRCFCFHSHSLSGEKLAKTCCQCNLIPIPHGGPFHMPQLPFAVSMITHTLRWTKSKL